MALNQEGFWTPVVDEQKCISCGICVRCCPALKEKSLLQAAKTPVPYSVWALDDNIRSTSSSGGAFSILAEHILELGGCVYGASWSQEMRGGAPSVGHERITDKENLFRIRGSKYIPSYIGSTYRQVLKDLKEGRPVLFCGTPCQAAALRFYVKKDYEQLYILDVACHGVPSMKLFHAYIKQETVSAGKRVRKVDFRNKIHGWSPYHVVCEYEDGTYAKPVNFNKVSFMNAFLSDICLNNSCYDCRFLQEFRRSDLTLADFWCLYKAHPDWKDNKGVSLVLSHTAKGQTLLHACKDKMFMLREEWDVIKDTNFGFRRPPHFIPPLTRTRFFDMVGKQDLNLTMKQTIHNRKPKLDVAILGKWYGCNFGAVFTSYALYKTLERMGLTAALLDIAETDRQKDTTTPFRCFLQEERVCTMPVSIPQAYCLNDQFETFLCGSDLTWSHDYLSQFYFLDFVKGEKRKVAYAPSMSTYMVPPASYRKKISKLLRRFDGVSYREQQMIGFFKENYGYDGTWVMDPVFLLSRKDWQALADKHKETNKSYIASYILDPTPERRQLLQNLSSRLQLPLQNIVDVSLSPDDNVKKLGLDSTKLQPSLYEWLSNIAHCDYFVTDSYHGVCFAIIFNKPFICLNNTKRGSIRFESLLGLLNLRDRMVADTTTQISEALLVPPPYGQVNDILDKRIDFSYDWLKNAMLGKRDPMVELYNKKTDRSLTRKPSVMREMLTKLKIKASLIYHAIKK